MCKVKNTVRPVKCSDFFLLTEELKDMKIEQH